MSPEELAKRFQEIYSRLAVGKEVPDPQIVFAVCREILQGRVLDESIRVTVVSEDLDIARYRQGDIGKMRGVFYWTMCCPLCRTMATCPSGSIEKHEDGTVSTNYPLHCHGKNAMLRYRIDHNQVRFVE